MNQKQMDEQEQAQKINDSLDELENQRTIGISKAGSEQQTKGKALIRERQRLEQKYGPNHERVRKIDRQLDTNPKLFQAIEEVKVRSAAQSPQPETEKWGVYGTVKDEQNQRLPGLTISIFDDKGKWARDLGYICTNDKGYYALEVLDEDGRLAKKYEGQPLVLTVTDDERRVLHREEEPLVFTIGKLENREIILPEEVCGTPPENGGQQSKEDYLVRGTITDLNGRPLGGLHVKAVDLDFTGENPLGQETVTDDKGFFQILYKAEDFIIEGKESGGADIILYVYDAKGELIQKTDVFKNSPKVRIIDIKIETKGKKGA